MVIPSPTADAPIQQTRRGSADVGWKRLLSPLLPSFIDYLPISDNLHMQTFSDCD
jgi:hypothetical protein